VAEDQADGLAVLFGEQSRDFGKRGVEVSRGGDGWNLGADGAKRSGAKRQKNGPGQKQASLACINLFRHFVSAAGR